jgi:asparagine N-glycosylation enzyme membrane subunit Stt3
MRFLSGQISRHKEKLPLLAGLMFVAPVLFFQAFRHSFPLGYAGMFTLMAELVAGAGFGLPENIPHYGPGGIPFVYPPLAAYLFAAAMKMGFPTWAYLRLAPALFTLLALIPFYYLAKELLNSKLAGLAAIVLVAVAPAFYYTHVWSAGIVRGLAVGLCFGGLLFYVRALKDFSWGSFWLSGLLLGLLLATHWMYVAFAALFGAAYMLTHWNPRHIKTSLGILLTALLLAAPWLGFIVSRHGLESILAAASSHRNVEFLTLFQDSRAALAFLSENFRHITDNLFLMLLALPGFILLVARRQFHLPLVMLLVMLMGEASFYSVIVAGMLAGAFCAWVFRFFSIEKQQNRPLWVSGGLGLLAVLAIGLSAASGISQIYRYEPEIDVYSLKMAQFVREETDPNVDYYYIGKINEAEWFPYLLDRAPVIGIWGSEWKGTYAEQLEIMIAMRACQNDKDWGCMQSLLEQHNANPGLLIGPANRWLELEIRETREWEVIYRDERYLVWERR